MSLEGGPTKLPPDVRTSVIWRIGAGHNRFCFYRRLRPELSRTVNKGNGVKAYAEKVGLKIDWDDPSSTISPLAFITQVPRAFDYESSHWAPQFHHTGPFHDGNGREPLDFPWERLTGEPLIYASMGTILNGRLDVFRTIVAALAKHKDLQLVLFDRRPN